ISSTLQTHIPAIDDTSQFWRYCTDTEFKIICLKEEKVRSGYEYEVCGGYNCEVKAEVDDKREDHFPEVRETSLLTYLHAGIRNTSTARIFFENYFGVYVIKEREKWRLIGFNQQWIGCPQPLCLMPNVDAAFAVEKRIFLFRGYHYWELENTGKYTIKITPSSQSAKLNTFVPGGFIDFAVRVNKSIFLTKGDWVYQFDENMNKLKEHFQVSQALKLDSDIPAVSAAFANNKFIYLFLSDFIVWIFRVNGGIYHKSFSPANLGIYTLNIQAAFYSEEEKLVYVLSQFHVYRAYLWTTEEVVDNKFSETDKPENNYFEEFYQCSAIYAKSKHRNLKALKAFIYKYSEPHLLSEWQKQTNEEENYALYLIIVILLALIISFTILVPLVYILIKYRKQRVLGKRPEKESSFLKRWRGFYGGRAREKRELNKEKTKSASESTKTISSRTDEAQSWWGRKRHPKITAKAEFITVPKEIYAYMRSKASVEDLAVFVKKSRKSQTISTASIKEEDVKSPKNTVDFESNEKFLYVTNENIDRIDQNLMKSAAVTRASIREGDIFMRKFVSHLGRYDIRHIPREAVDTAMTLMEKM
ncbi:hypothetical protein B4U79_17419, partial [Dinothrombium tinctorium]